MRADWIALDVAHGMAHILAHLGTLEVSIITTSYRADAPGVAIEMMTEEDAEQAARILDCEPRDCPVHGRSFIRYLGHPQHPEACLVVTWIEIDVPDDASELL